MPAPILVSIINENINILANVSLFTLERIYPRRTLMRTVNRFRCICKYAITFLRGLLFFVLVLGI